MQISKEIEDIAGLDWLYYENFADLPLFYY